MRVVTFDIETVGAMRGSFDPSILDLTICGVHDSETGQYEAYLRDDLPKLWQVLEHTDMLVGYNSDHFDIPILNKYYPGDLTHIKSLDIMKEVQNVIGRRIKLDAIAAATLGTKKSGNGLDAVRWWKEGNIKKLRTYCIKDVEITRRVFDYALEHGSIKYKDLGATHEVKLDTRGWMQPASKAMTFSLGF